MSFRNAGGSPAGLRLAALCGPGTVFSLFPARKFPITDQISPHRCARGRQSHSSSSHRPKRRSTADLILQGCSLLAAEARGDEFRGLAIFCSRFLITAARAPEVAACEPWACQPGEHPAGTSEINHDQQSHFGRRFDNICLPPPSFSQTVCPTDRPPPRSLGALPQRLGSVSASQIECLSFRSRRTSPRWYYFFAVVARVVW